MLIYNIQCMDSICSIAKRFNITVSDILLANPNLNPVYIRPGTTINIPLPYYRYITYNILGSTNKISKTQMDNLIRLRNRVVNFAKNHLGEVYINGQPNEKKISITFDDGPDSSVTLSVLSILKNNNVKASFFFVGKQINSFPHIVKMAYDQGHLILNHSWNHPDFIKVNSQSIINEITLTEKRIQNIIGKKPAIIRPPYGSIDEKALSAINSTDNKVAIWSIDSMDWVRNIDKQTIIENIINNARPGDIILMHSGSGQNAVIEVLQVIIYELKNKGFRIVDLGELLGINPYK